MEALHFEYLLLKSLSFKERSLCLNLEDPGRLCKPSRLVLETPRFLCLHTGLTLFGCTNLSEDLLLLYFSLILSSSSWRIRVHVAMRAETMRYGACTGLRRLLSSIQITKPVWQVLDLEMLR